MMYNKNIMGNAKYSIATKVFSSLWVCSLIIFFILISTSVNTSGPTELTDRGLGITVISGIIFFIILFISAVIDEKNRKKVINKKQLNKDNKNETPLKAEGSSNNSWVIVAFLTIMGLSLLYYLNNLKEQNENLLKTVSSLNKKVEDISPDNKKVDESKVIQPIQQTQKQVIDNDPIVDCPKGDNCGGGIRKLKKSICSNSTCCEVSKNNWVFMESKEQCYRQQDTSYQEASKYWSIEVEGNGYLCDIGVKNEIYNAYDNLKKYTDFYNECLYLKEYTKDYQVKANCDNAKLDRDSADDTFWKLIERNCKKK